MKHFVICDAARPIGGMGLTTREGDLWHSIEIGYCLGKPFWGRGIATAVVKVLTARIQERGERARFPFSRTRFRLTVSVRHECGYDGVRTRWGTQGLGDE